MRSRPSTTKPGDRRRVPTRPVPVAVDNRVVPLGPAEDKLPHRLLLLVVATLAVIVTAAALIPGSEPVIMLSAPPVQAEQFVDSIGVNTHLSYVDTSYGGFSRILERLHQLGVRHIRDAIFPQTTPTELERLDSLAQTGIRATFVAGDPSHGSAAAALAVVDRVAPVVEALEGPNEWDLHGGPHWVRTLRHYQTELYVRAHADPLLRGVPVLAPSLVYGDWPHLGNISNIVDVGNGHPYSRGTSPEGIIDEQLAQFRLNSASRPVWVTETGYQTDPLATNGQPGVNERVAAGLILRTYLEYFIHGVQRTFLYEFADERPDPRSRSTEPHFGLLHYNLSPKPSFIALMRLISLVSDPGPRFTPGQYAVSLHGETGAIKALTLAKRDGTIELVLWRRVVVWDPEKLAPVPTLSQRVRIVLPQRATMAQLFVPTQSAAPDRTFRQPRSVTVDLGENPVVLQILRSSGK